MRAFITLCEREIYRFLRLSRQTLFPPIITTLLFILVFGYSLGSSIREIHGIPYIIYILPGLAAMSVITNAYANSSTSLFMARMDKSIENKLTAPISPQALVLSIVIGGLLRGLMIGLLSLIVSKIMLDFSVYSWTLTVISLTVSSVVFSCMGLLSALWAESWDQIATFTNFIMTPLIYLGGVFYSIDLLPATWQHVSRLNPIFYLVDSLRYAVLQQSSISYFWSLAYGLGLSGVLFALCAFLVGRGYKLKS